MVPPRLCACRLWPTQMAGLDLRGSTGISERQHGSPKEAAERRMASTAQHDSNGHEVSHRAPPSRLSAIMLSNGRHQRAHKSTFGKHGLDVAPAVIREDERLCTSRPPHGSLL